MSMKNTRSAYYWIMAVACIIPGIASATLSDGMGKDWIFFGLLFLSAIGFTTGIMMVNGGMGRTGPE
jgi:hypothetical protein